MRTMIKLGLFGLGMLLALVILNGCFAPPQGPFDVMVTPDKVHPPCKVTITAPNMGGGTYSFESTGCAAVQSTERTHSVVIYEWPWSCRVTWMDGLGGFLEDVVTVGLDNVGPTILRPLLDGKTDLWFGAPLERVLIDCNYHAEEPLYPGYQSVVTGIIDPEGDDCTLIGLEIKCDLLDEPDTLFFPPYRPGEFHADGIDNAAIWYPAYISPDLATDVEDEWERETVYDEGDKVQHGKYIYQCTKGHTATANKEPFKGKKWHNFWKSLGGNVDVGLPYPPYPEYGYPFDACMDNDIPFMPGQMATITITAEDQFGAATTETFRIPIGAAGCVHHDLP